MEQNIGLFWPNQCCLLFAIVKYIMKPCVLAKCIQVCLPLSSVGVYKVF